jgi:hypothetical protein
MWTNHKETQQQRSDVNRKMHKPCKIPSAKAFWAGLGLDWRGGCAALCRLVPLEKWEHGALEEHDFFAGYHHFSPNFICFSPHISAARD